MNGKLTMVQKRSLLSLVRRIKQRRPRLAWFCCCVNSLIFSLILSPSHTEPRCCWSIFSGVSPRRFGMSRQALPFKKKNSLASIIKARICSNTLKINVLIQIVLRLRIAQCSGVLWCVWSNDVGLAPKVISSRTGSRACTFQAAWNRKEFSKFLRKNGSIIQLLTHISAVIPPRSCKSGLTPRAMKYATSAVWPNCAAMWIHEQPSVSLKE